MVEVTIYLEGGTMPGEKNAAASTVSNTEVFREKFNQLFAQQLDADKLNLKVRNMGSVSQTRKRLKKIKEKGEAAVLLIDLDAPASEMKKRLIDNYDSEPVTGIIFFMVQKMESWILSQSHILDELATTQNWERKKKHLKDAITDDKSLKGIHPEAIKNSDTRMNTIFQQYFCKEDLRKNKFVNVKYRKMKEGPLLIGLLDLDKLCNTFSEAARLIDYIKTLT